MQKERFNPVFIISVTISLFVIFFGWLFNDDLVTVSEIIMSWVSQKFGWLYVLSVMGFMCFLLWIAL